MILGYGLLASLASFCRGNVSAKSAVWREDAVHDPNTVQRALTDSILWLGTLHPFSDYHQHATLSSQSERAMHDFRAINTDSIGSWQDNLLRVVAQIQRHSSIHS